MAYSLPHNISLQQLTELQRATNSTSPTPPTSSRFSMDSDQASLRHILHKPRDQQQQQVDNALDKLTDTGGDDEEEEEQEEGAAGASEQGEDGSSEDTRPPAGAGTTGGAAGTNSSLLVASTSGSKGLQGDHPPPTVHNPNPNPSAGPTWLSNAMLRQASAAVAAPSYNHWLQLPSDLGDAQAQAQHSQGGSGDAGNNETPGGLNVKGFLELHGAADTANSGGGGGGGGEEMEQQQQQQQQEGQVDAAAMESKLWQSARLKADLVTHPLYEQLLSAHISCLRTATPVDQLPKIDAQLAHSTQVAAKYSMLATGDPSSFTKDKDEVNEFMAHYVTLLRSFKEQLQQHVRVHAMEAVVACWELEQSLFTLTGVSPGEGSGATMSEDEDEQADSDSGYFDTGMDGHDFTGFGPLIPTETERTLMERVRHELKIELKQGYKAKINDVREEILRKRRAGKLPGDTTSVLKSWWHAHSKWPYPSEDDKARLVQETGLELKQINNWFINQRKRNWHSNPSSSTSLKNKRKR